MMRPSPVGDALPPPRPRSRKSSVADQSAYSSPSSHVPTTFFLRSEDDLDQSSASSEGANTPNRPRDSTFGVQSLEDTLGAAFGQDIESPDKLRERAAATKGHEHKASRRSSNVSPRAPNRHCESSRPSPVKRPKRQPLPDTIPNPLLTPLNVDTPFPIPPSAIPSTPRSASSRSLKLSDEDSNLDDVASQAITSGGEDEGDAERTAADSFPQLVMPSIQMPSRRPFTPKGKAMGKLKILVAGEAGIGKTSLIRSIVQLCEDIVHVDPLSPQSLAQSPLPPNPKTTLRSKKGSSFGTSQITQIHASTKAYPHWYTDLGESHILRRRKSSADSVLERNICFVDTPGHNSVAIVDYVESLLVQTCSVASMEDSDILGVMSGNGGITVDLILYMLPSSNDISKDVERMERLSALTNVVPIIAKSDTLSPPDVVAIKTSMLAHLQNTSIKPFLFGTAVEDALLAVQGLAVPSSSPDPNTTTEPDQYPFNTPTYPYAVSSIHGPDMDTMDASLLMSPDYVQPLFPSELGTLVEQVFDPDSIAWLRHSAAKKFLAWRRRTRLPGDSFILHGLAGQSRQHGSVASSSIGLHGAPPIVSRTSSIFSAASPSGVLVPRASSPFYLSNSHLNSNLQSPFPGSSPSLSHAQSDGLEGPSDFSLARYNAHLSNEQHFSEIRMAKWATDLQRSLRNERDRYEELQRGERAQWLLDQVSQEVKEGNIITSPGGTPRAEWAVVRHKKGKDMNITGQRYGTSGRLDSRDPLGLCNFRDEVRRRGFVLVKVLGGMSVIGAVVVAVVKACGLEAGLPEGGFWSWMTGGRAE
ncbi:hypothetical protein EJ04DRAFT_480481 [Polyplosphaeria fusca]|uniref:Septin-type G domain-containing protein n=1 Tax=Polyplosphaeria fusca TaxID=682080 RepID=A0A9P4VA49_9PLEO|nr:hypothetical protein EJ04DRAFT_480481 [Polyplosphaeria fusca]